MGNEASTPAAEGGSSSSGADPFNPYAHVVIKKAAPPPPPPEPEPEPMIPARQGRTSRNQSEGGISADGKKAAAAPKPVSQWMYKSQTKISTTEVRKGRYPSASGARPLRTSAQTLESQMGALLKTEEKAPEQTAEQVMAEKKADLMSRLNNFINVGANKAIKVPTDGLPKMAVVPPKQKWSLPADQRNTWMSQLAKSKQEVMSAIKEGDAPAVPLYEPMTQEDVGEEVEKSLGSTLNTFAGYQGTINHILESGLSEEMLQEFFMDEESEQQLTTYEKWSIIRHAAEQVLQVYANRSNARTAESEQWVPPQVVDVRSGAAAVYSNTVDSALAQGTVALLFIDDGRLVEAGKQATDVQSLLSSDLWQAVKELAPHKVPSGQRLERLSVLGRHLLGAALGLEMKYGPTSVKSLKVVLAVDSEQEQFTVNELQQWSFFGLQSHHVIILPQPRFQGFAQDAKRDVLAHVKGSPRLLMGTGYALFLLNSPGEAYTLDPTGSTPTCLHSTVLEQLRELKSNWLYTGLFSDLERLRPDQMLDTDFLSGAIYGADRWGANMAMEVVQCHSERDMRTYNSIVLTRANGHPGACNLSTSAMRTVKSYQVAKSQASNPEGFHVATQRYAFKIAALQRILTDPANLNVDVQLHGLYAYATLDLADITIIKDANCAAVLGRNVPGPVMSDAVFTGNWLPFAAGCLEDQDKVEAFRQRAIDLIRIEKVSGSSHHIQGMPASSKFKPGVGASPQKPQPQQTHVADTSSPGAKFKERKQGLTVVMLLTAEHKSIAAPVTRLARLFIRNIVDRLHVVLAVGSTETGGINSDLVMQVMDEVNDKELEFNGQLSREVITRNESGRIIDAIQDVLVAQSAGLVVVPSLKLTGGVDLGSNMASLALAVAKNITGMPVLVVKGNSIGRFASTSPAIANSSAAHDHLTAMAHLDSTAVGPMIEAVSKVLNPVQDVFFLAKTNAFDKPGLLSMRSRRVFVQARMALSIADALGSRLQERAFAGGAVTELCKAVEAELVDLLFVSVNGELPISKEIEDVLKAAKTSVFIFRNKDVVQTNAQPALVVEEPAPTEGYSYGKRH